MSTLHSNANYSNVQRDKLNYEILNVKHNQTSIIIDGWATMPSTQHFKGEDTHNYILELKGQRHEFQLPGSIKSADLTQQLSYRGNPKCNNSILNANNCNYDHKNVGFSFTIPLEKLKANENYELYLKMHAKQANKSYRIPIFYVSEGERSFRQNHYEYIIQSDFSHAKFSIYAHTLVARTGPNPNSEALRIGNTCSIAHGNDAFLKQNARFMNIRGIDLYNNQITYFKVGVQSDSCVNERRRVIESTTSKTTAYVPSTHVNYLGDPMMIKVRAVTSKPLLFAQDIVIMQYDRYNLFDKVSANDFWDGDISSKITLTSSDVNTKRPGIYSTCYSVFNSSLNEARGCRKVTVLKAPTRKRYVSKFTIHDTRLRWWNRNNLKSILTKDNAILSEKIYP